MNKTEDKHIVVYSRGFIRHVDVVPENKHVDGDAEVAGLWDIYMKGRVDHSGWAYRRSVISAAVRLLGSMPYFVTTQKLNPYLYGYNYEFLLDTLNYIKTGKRKMSIVSWKGLLSENGAPNADYKLRATKPENNAMTKFEAQVKQPTQDIISEWCSHPKGFDDMLQTLDVMFGRVWNPLHETVSLHADYYDHFKD